MEELIKEQHELVYKIEWATIHGVDDDEIRAMFRKLDMVEEKIVKAMGLE